MSATATTELRVPIAAPGAPALGLGPNSLSRTALSPVQSRSFAMPARKVLRRIDAQSGHALEILGHAIEYLADEYAHAGGSLRSSDGEVQAIQLLMALNREIYLACPEVPTFADRCSALAHHLGFRHHRN